MAAIGGDSVNPAGAMGTFIRTWRVEWAGLSRAQVAIAVNGHGRRGRRVTEAIIRRWEEGQPPKSTEELEALCEVMGKHGLSPLEVKQFRQAVFAACADRQFPELFTNDEWVYEDTVDEVTRAVAHREGHAPGSISIVHLVAIESELTRTVRNAETEGVSRRQAERQRDALLRVIDVLIPTSAVRGRPRVVGALATKGMSLIEMYSFGDNSAGCDASAPGWRARTAFAIHPDDVSARGRHWLRMGQEANRRGERDLARAAVCHAAHAALNARDPELLEYVWASRGLLEPNYGYMAGWIASARNRPRDAEPYIDLWPPLVPGNTGQQWLWARCMASFAMAAGNCGEAEEYLGEAFDIAQRWGAPGCIDQVRRELKLCDRRPRAAGRKRKPAAKGRGSGAKAGDKPGNSTSKGKTNQSGKKRKR